MVADGVCPRGTGMSLALDKLEAAAARVARPRPEPGVLVCAKGGGGLLRQRMELVSELWEANIRAQMVHEINPTMAAQYEYAASSSVNLRWLVVLTEASSSSGTVKVFSLAPHPSLRTEPQTLEAVAPTHQWRPANGRCCGCTPGSSSGVPG